MKKPIVALMYDFDKTLCTKDMQEYGFIPSLGMSSSAFWGEVRQLTDSQEMDNILAYMYKMVEKAKEKRETITRETFKKLGEGVEYFDGVDSWFERINAYGEKMGVRIEHYIVSSGIKAPPYNCAQTIHVILADQSFEKKRNSSALFAREISLVTQPSFDCEQGINSQVQTACSNADAIFPVLGIVFCKNERFSLLRKTHVPLWNEPRISHVRLP